MRSIAWERRHLAGTFERTITKTLPARCRRSQGTALDLSAFGCGFAALYCIADLQSADSRMI